jgi:hypothetical protein
VSRPDAAGTRPASTLPASTLPASTGGVRLVSIHIYPMKAARAVDLGESLVEPWGLVGDRRWLLVDEDGRFVSQREEPSLARVVVTPLTETISISAAGFPGRRIAAPAARDGVSPGGRPPQPPPSGRSARLAVEDQHVGRGERRAVRTCHVQRASDPDNQSSSSSQPLCSCQ